MTIEALPQWSEKLKVKSEELRSALALFPELFTFRFSFFTHSKGLP